MLVGCGVEEVVEVAVAFVPFSEAEVCVAPWRRSWDDVDEVSVPVTDEFPTNVPIPRIVVEPKVVVRVVDPLVTVETIARVEIGEDVATVLVEVYER